MSTSVGLEERVWSVSGTHIATSLDEYGRTTEGDLATLAGPIDMIRAECTG